MWSEGSLHHEMMGWGESGESSWYWLLGFHGIMSALFLAVIVVVLGLLIRDLRRDYAERVTPAARDGKPNINAGEANVQTHLVRRS